MSPKKLYLLLTMCFPNGKRTFALTAKTYARHLGGCQTDAKKLPLTLKHWRKKIDKYTVYNGCRQSRPATLVARTNRLSLSKCLDLLRSGKGLPFVVDEVGAALLEVA
jgi:hypothetical protein